MNPEFPEKLLYLLMGIQQSPENSFYVKIDRYRTALENLLDDPLELTIPAIWISDTVEFTVNCNSNESLNICKDTIIVVKCKDQQMLSAHVSISEDKQRVVFKPVEVRDTVASIIAASDIDKSIRKNIFSSDIELYKVTL